MTHAPAPPYDDGYEEPEFRPRPAGDAHALTFVLAGAFLVGAGLLRRRARAEAPGQRGSTGTRRRATAAPCAFATGGSHGYAVVRRGAASAAGASAAAGPGGGGAVTGTVKLVDGKNVYVTDTSGNVVKVETGAGSAAHQDRPGHHEGRRPRRRRDRPGHPEQRRLVHRLHPGHQLRLRPRRLRTPPTVGT